MPSRGPARTRAVFAVSVPLLLLVALTAWAFASPVGASPDDDFHLPSIWCGLGERQGLCEASGNPATRLVPTELLTAPCFAFRPDQSGDCWEPQAEGLTEAERVNTAPLYPPLFYATMSLLAGQDVQTSVIAMRILNAVIAVGMATAVFWAMPIRLRPALIVSLLATSVPLGLFVLASTNPSSWALISAGTVWVSLFGALKSDGRRRLLLCGLAFTGGLLGAGARADAAAYAAFSVGLAAVMGARLNRQGVVPALTGAAIIIAGVLFYLGAGQGGSVAVGLPNENAPLTSRQLVDNLLGVPVLWAGALGGWGLGWLDTPMPAVVAVLSCAVACGAIFIGLKRVSTRRWIALGLTFTALWAVPFILLAQSRAVVGTIVQPRYILPLLVILLAVATANGHSRTWWRGPRVFVGAGALAIAAAIALHDNIRRYTTGLDDAAIDPGAGAEWWWVGAPPPLVMWVLGSSAFGAALLMIAVAASHRPQRQLTLPVGYPREATAAGGGTEPTTAISPVTKLEYGGRRAAGRTGDGPGLRPSPP